MTIFIHRLMLLTLCLLCFTTTATVHAKNKNNTLILKGQNLAINVFKVNPEDVMPYMKAGYEPAADEWGNYRLFIGSVGFNDTFGIQPFSELIVFTEVKPVGQTSDLRYFLTLWGAMNTEEATALYRDKFGLPFVYIPSLDITMNDRVQTTHVKVNDAKYGKISLNMKVQEMKGPLHQDFNNARIVGSVDNKTKLTKDIFGARFRESKLDTFELKATKDSPFALVSKANRIYTLLSTNHTTIFLHD